MRPFRTLKAVIGTFLLAATTLLALGATAPAQLAGASPSTSSHYTGILPDGTTWIADVPANWNGTLSLYSHGFGPLVAADAPTTATRTALLARGYALAGSSYDPNGSE